MTFYGAANIILSLAAYESNTPWNGECLKICTLRVGGWKEMYFYLYFISVIKFREDSYVGRVSDILTLVGLALGSNPGKNKK